MSGFWVCVAVAALFLVGMVLLGLRLDVAACDGCDEPDCDACETRRW